MQIGTDAIVSGTQLAASALNQTYKEYRMNTDEILDQLANLPSEVYAYTFAAALVGPLALRLLGFKALSQLIRPLALAVLIGGIYAKQEAQRGER